MNVLVVGDVIIDRYTHGRKRGVSAETPTVVANFDRSEMFIGGAGLVCRNLLRLGQDVTLLTTANCHEGAFCTFMHDQDDKLTSEELGRFRPVISSFSGWSFTEKRRYYVDDYKMVQYDLPNRGTYINHMEEFFIQNFVKSLQGKHAVVVSDNCHGVVTENIAKTIIRLSREAGVMTYVDAQWSQTAPHYTWYKGADWILMNDYELEGVGNRLPYDFKRRLKNAKNTLVSQVGRWLDCGIVNKRGEKGAILCGRDGKIDIVLGHPVDAVDTCGAGDAFLAAFVAHGRIDVANAWAAISTTYNGTIVPKIEELSMEFKFSEQK